MSMVTSTLYLHEYNWRHALDNNLFTGAVLMDLSKAFDCISHNLLIVERNAKINLTIYLFLQNYNFGCTKRFNTRYNPVQHFYK